MSRESRVSRPRLQSHIAIDRRHLTWASPQFLSKFGGLAYSPDVYLKYGDANWWSGDFTVFCAVEIKRGLDVLDSVLHTGRLLEQLREARTHAGFYRIIVQGELGLNPDTGNWGEKKWRRNSDGKLRFEWTDVEIPRTRETATFRAVDNFLNSIAILNFVQVVRSRDEDETVAQLINLYHWWQKPLDSHSTVVGEAVYTPKFLPSGSTSLTRRWAKEIPGIGLGKSKAFDRAFPSAFAMATATVEELESVDGIGKTLAKRAWEAIHHEKGIPGRV